MLSVSQATNLASACTSSTVPNRIIVLMHLNMRESEYLFTKSSIHHNQDTIRLSMESLVYLYEYISIYRYKLDIATYIYSKSV